MWQKIFGWSKKIHRVTMWVVILLGSTMMLTGYLMNRQLAGDTVPAREVMLLVRKTHVTVSMWFLWSLLIQIMTGLGMWLAPKMLSRKRKEE